MCVADGECSTNPSRGISRADLSNYDIYPKAKAMHCMSRVELDLFHSPVAYKTRTSSILKGSVVLVELLKETEKGDMEDTQSEAQKFKSAAKKVESAVHVRGCRIQSPWMHGICFDRSPRTNNNTKGNVELQFGTDTKFDFPWHGRRRHTNRMHHKEIGSN